MSNHYAPDIEPFPYVFDEYKSKKYFMLVQRTSLNSLKIIGTEVLSSILQKVNERKTLQKLHNSLDQRK